MVATDPEAPTAPVESASPAVEVDVRSVTLGELAAVEAASGRSFDELLKGRASRLLMFGYIGMMRQSRTPGSPSYGVEPSWSELASRQLFGD